ncbi:hypothetical protein N2152v2_008934 [Parachlorella kessleri]
MFKRKAGEALNGSEKNQKTGNSDRRATFVQHLKALNQQFASWVQEQLQDHTTELWTDGVEDYVQHASRLLKDFGDVLDGPASEQQAAGDKPAPAGALLSRGPAKEGFSFGALPSGKGPLSFLGGAGASQPATAPAFAALPSTSSGFNFAAAPAAPGLFKIPSVPSTGTLGTGTSGTTLGGGATTGDEDDGGEEEQQQPEEPSVQLEPSDAEILLKQRIKLMSLMEEGTSKKWKDKGAGTLTLRRAKGEAAAGKLPYLVFTTDSGRVLINAPLVRGMKPTCNPKTPANFAMFLINTVEGKEQRGMHLFKCGDAGAAKELSEKLLEFV